MAAVCAVGVLVGLVAWVVGWRMLLILWFFLLPDVCSGCVCSGGSSGTGGVGCWLEDFSNTMVFLLSEVCSGCVCSGGSSGTGGVDCVLEDVCNTLLFSVP